MKKHQETRGTLRLKTTTIRALREPHLEAAAGGATGLFSCVRACRWTQNPTDDCPWTEGC